MIAIVMKHDDDAEYADIAAVAIDDADPTTRIPNSSCCCCVTKTVTWRYLGNQEWYHRSAGVKTTGKKIMKNFCKKNPKISKMSKIL